MRVTPTQIPEALVIEPKVFSDERGVFYESYNERVFREATGIEVQFVQDNHSRSAQGVLRGLHYQLPPAAQGKLVRCVVGEVFDVAVDIRRRSPTCGQWVGIHLSADNKRLFWVPPGFAHGFLVLSEVADVLYKTTHDYAPHYDRTIRWDDPDLAIAWPSSAIPLLSDKDRSALRFAETEIFA